MSITLPYTIAEGDTTNADKLEANFTHLQDGLNNKPLSIVAIADADAPNSSLYYSTTASKLVWKDSAGAVKALY
jgi:hypothetical protein